MATLCSRSASAKATLSICSRQSLHIGRRLKTTNRNYRRERQFWHDGRNYTSSLGCGICLDRRTCGGLCTERAFYDCLDSCCRQPESCDAVCRAKPREFAQRVREVGGFEFVNIPRATKVPALTLPRVVPVLFHGSSRQMPFIAPTVCLPLYAIIARHGATPALRQHNRVTRPLSFSAGYTNDTYRDDQRSPA